MNVLRRAFLLVLLLPAVAGCAGGWRGGSPPAAWSATATPTSAAPARESARAKSSGTHATADGAVFVYAGEAKSVSVAGEFNSWNTSADPLTHLAGGSWQLEKKLAPGKYAYKFVLDGGTWKEDATAPGFVDDGYGGKNSVVEVGGAAATAAPAASGVVPSGGVTFKFTGDATSVALAGEFNSWSTSADPLKKQADGSWSITKTLPPGKYAYKFVLDGGTWKEDPAATASVDDGYGGKNSVVEVSGALATAPAAKPVAGGTAPAVGAGGVTFKFTGAATSVALAGEFNSWSTSADPLKKQADGSWAITKTLAPGKYAYKFVLDGGTWKEDPAATAFVDDGYGGKNSVVEVGAGAAVAPAAPAAKPAAGGAAPAVTAGGVTFKYSGAGNSVNLAGEFNSWSTSADPLKKQADGTWAITKALPAGKYAYKFVIDGGTWKEDPGATVFVDDGYGGKNSVVEVGAGAAAAAAPAAPATKALAAGVKPVAPKATAAGVVFTYAGAAKQAVVLCGDFNGWVTNANPMKQQADGSWTITLPLKPGSYGYKFLVDGATWKQDDGNPEAKDDGFGGKNSVIVVK